MSGDDFALVERLIAGCRANLSTQAIKDVLQRSALQKQPESGAVLGVLCSTTSPLCRLCCKSRKLQGSEFFAKTQSGKQSPIRITSFALPKSPMSLTRGDEVPPVVTRKSRLQPAEFLITSAKRLLQHNLPNSDIGQIMFRGSSSYGIDRGIYLRRSK